GNLRELSKARRVAAALSEGAVIGTDSLPDHLFAEPAAARPGGEDALRQALTDCGNNISALARKLGVNRSTIHRRLKRLN
ncbi:MAG: winged helix-turn-helix transcriptional regulator, partial [Rhizobiales bacterium]|nr:winged helix-turn-helix transcriptional regulator [Hyphomicrobiales bacterium]